VHAVCGQSSRCGERGASHPIADKKFPIFKEFFPLTWEKGEITYAHKAYKVEAGSLL
jgi:hypothetical protein